MEFNEEQKKIISNIRGAYLISAPVGTGKTTVIAERVAMALREGISPEKILCLTFTNRAAEEMRTRIRRRVDDKKTADLITIETFHGFCVRFLRIESKRMGKAADFTIIDDDEQAELLSRLAGELGMAELAGVEKRILLNALEMIYKNEMSLLENEIGCQTEVSGLDKELEELGRMYRAELEKQDATDFNGLVLATLEAIYLQPEIRAEWQDRYRLIQLDEFQDTHLSEYLVVKELAKKSGNIALIGDLDQTIYSWRGSKPFFIAKLFRTHFSPVTELNLTINYRFNPLLLKAVKSFLACFENSETKELNSHSSLDPSLANAPKPIHVHAAYNDSEEASYCIDTIKRIRKEEPQASIAILARSNPIIAKLAQNFEDRGIAHVTVDKYNFFRRQEVKDVFAYLKLLFNRYDSDSAARVIARPARNIGEKTLEKLKSEGRAAGLQLADFFDFKNYGLKEPFENLAKKWQKGRIVVLDTETTGTNPFADEIIQIYAIEVVDGEPRSEFDFYIKNSKPVGNSEAIHGISDAFLSEKGEAPADILGKLKEFIGNDPVSGHNVNFDLSMIRENGARLGIDFDFKEYYDTLDLSRRLINSENYKLGTLAKRFGLAEATHDARDDVQATVGLLGILVKMLADGTGKRTELFSAFSPKFIKLAATFDAWKKSSATSDPIEILERIWRESGLEEYYLNDPRKEQRLKSISDLSALFAERNDPEKRPEASLREMVAYASLVRNLDFLGVEKGKVPIITVHQSKGLEFDYIFIVGLNEFRFPAYKSDLEEEKRLFYVALTRAKKGIYLTHSLFDNYNRNLARSRFIDAIGQEYIG